TPLHAAHRLVRVEPDVSCSIEGKVPSDSRKLVRLAIPDGEPLAAGRGWRLIQREEGRRHLVPICELWAANDDVHWRRDDDPLLRCRDPLAVRTRRAARNASRYASDADHHQRADPRSNHGPPPTYRQERSIQTLTLDGAGISTGILRGNLAIVPHTATREKS